ncbi:flagellin [Alphaproteobacteria bacterium]|nr:flagellin [Alphaproteobacteria bacterium]
MTVINTNIGALNARHYSAKAELFVDKALERLSSGRRINSASDDAAGLAVASKMTSQVLGMKMAVRNTQDGISLVQTAEGSMNEINSMLLRMRELAVQMHNSVYTSKDRDNAQMEVNALLQQIDQIAENAKFNGVNLLDGSYHKEIRAGNTNAEVINVAINNMATTSMAKMGVFATEKAIDGGNDLATDQEVTAAESTEVSIDTSLFSTAFKDVFKNDGLGVFSLTTTASTGGDNTLFDIDPKTGKITSKAALDAGAATDTNGNGSTAGDGVYDIEVTYTPRNGAAAHVEVVHLTVSAMAEKNISNVDVTSEANVTRSIEMLDKALVEVASGQARLGALQNRMEYTISNLTQAAMNIEIARGRITDADFAVETTVLAKHQILAQAASAMLAQANQAKQSVLTLLQ